MTRIQILFLMLITACQTNQQEMNKHTNSLVNSTSPYLLQHAHNPVNWQEWGEEALNQAKEEDKPILVSIGYSSCHWCHVMEKESFEDTDVAGVMNRHFVNIKVDREERPDVDQIYMDAVHAMGIQGGWPLNVFLTPDQKPFYGGTYFPKKGWVNLLSSIAEAYQSNRDKINESAEAFTKSIQANEAEKYKLDGTDHLLTKEQSDAAYQNLKRKFDHIDGGIKKSPKFPMPSVWNYLAAFQHFEKNQEAKKHFHFTLKAIANGGIYDHVGGGFARYSTDEEWHVPHFEKMLYDNGQLLSLFADGYKVTKDEQFKEVILETAAWLQREMLDESGGFYSALDADSEGEEGKFYVWDYREVQDLVSSNHIDILSALYDIKPEGNWEGKNVLRIVKDKEDILKRFDLGEDQLSKIIVDFKSTALEKRVLRTRPGLDNKIIAGWNGLALTGLSQSYQALQDPLLLELASMNAQFIKNDLIRNGILYRFPDKDLEGFMEDYAAIIQALIVYYETSTEKEYLDLAVTLTQRTEEKFYDEADNFYFFTSDESESLIARKKEIFDNVIPSSNSMMAWNLVHLGTHFYNDEMVKKGKSIFAQVKSLIMQDAEYLSNWAILGMELANPFAEIVVVGPEAKKYVNEINQRFLPASIITASEKSSDSAPFEHKSLIDGQTTIYVCYNKACKLPVTTVEEAMKQLDIN